MQLVHMWMFELVGEIATYIFRGRITTCGLYVWLVLIGAFCSANTERASVASVSGGSPCSAIACLPHMVEDFQSSSLLWVNMIICLILFKFVHF